ncbi:VanZ like family protein [Nitrosospira sp. Nsp11]|uniref:VanZ family protein n=1 Tax=Nitrosospira sp. Nsp11 TaxID=1855338 RepID=UPI000918A0FB|nr:VanZ family protein [Nitrosospira sp. Nsp11]SHL78817.1 VanZ like family protein [Nitrosospira sp. Nsp11]
MRVLSVIVVLIAYGSLYPGDISEPGAGAVKQFLTDWNLLTSRGDMLGNVALFFPLGMAGILFTRKRSDSRIGVATLLFLALIYSFGLQLAQVWLPSRSAALADVAWNMVGTAAGIATAHLIATRSSARGQPLDVPSLVPLVVLVLWLLTELLPLVPSLDIQKFKDALKPLFLVFSFSFPATTMHAAGIVVAGNAFTALGQRAAWWLGASILLLWAGKVVIVNLTLDASLLLGTLAGYGGYLIALRAGRKMPFEVAFWLLLAAWNINALTPFSPAPGGTFNGIPFATMLGGSMEVNVRVLVQSLFTYTAMLWLIQKMGVSIKGAAFGLAIWSSLLELIQMGLLGRTADVTEPILLLGIGWALSAAQGSIPQPHPQPSGARDAVHAGKQHGATLTSSRDAWWMLQGFILLCFAGSIWGVLRMPGIPYNLREMFLGDAHFFFLLVFAGALLWVGAGAVWASRKIGTSNLPFLSFPIWALLVSLISLMLLATSVTQESIDDIVGSNNLYWFVVNWDIWGSGWREFFLLAGPDVIGLLERLGRYTALYGPLLIFLVLIFVSFDLHEHGSPRVPHAILLIASALPWLWLAKSVTFDWSSTDNLNELIMRDGPMGWGGGGYLYALLGLVCFNAVSLGRGMCSFQHLPIVIIGSIAGLPVGWWLLSMGLEPNVEKYGFTFSGIQFLLGPDREHLLSNLELFVRWCAVQLGFIIIVALGIRIGMLNPYQTRNASIADASQHRPY